jgi:CHASE3 domain sensor protein
MWAKAAYIEGLRSRPIPIVEAANRVNSLLNRRIDAAQDAQKAFTRRETYLVVALISAVLVAAGMVWWLR